MRVEDGVRSNLSAKAKNTMWQEWTNAVLGLVVLVVAFLGLTGATLTWTLAIAGLAIIAISLSGATGVTTKNA